MTGYLLSSCCSSCACVREELCFGWSLVAHHGVLEGLLSSVGGSSIIMIVFGLQWCPDGVAPCSREFSRRPGQLALLVQWCRARDPWVKFVSEDCGVWYSERVMGRCLADWPYFTEVVVPRMFEKGARV